jgi:hypothetical protein
VILTILRFTDARDTPQVGAKALFRRLDFVPSVQIHPLGRKYAAC